MTDRAGQRDCVFCFDGGGAKGLAHIAALEVLLNFQRSKTFDARFPKVKPVGFTGASVGAIVACLFAVGYRPSDLITVDARYRQAAVRSSQSWSNFFIFFFAEFFSSQSFFSDGTRSNLLNDLGCRRVTDLIGWWNWVLVRLFRFFALSIIGFITFLMFVGIMAAFALANITSLRRDHFGPFWEEYIDTWSIDLWKQVSTFLGEPPTFFPHPPGLYEATITVLALSLVGAIGILVFRQILSGIASTATIQKFINRAIQMKLGLSPSDSDLVTFAQLKEKGCLPLKIVATNIGNGSVEVFSAQTNPNLPVAQAVAASIAIPVIFKPVEIGHHGKGENGLYCDGALISSMPAWTFDAERDLDPDLVTVVCDLQDDRATHDLKPFKLIARVIHTAAFGLGQIQTRGINKENIALASKLGILDFDASPRRIAIAYDAATELVKRQCKLVAFRRELQFAFLEFVHNDMLGRLNSLAHANKRHRVALAVKAENNAGGLKIIETYGYNIPEGSDTAPEANYDTDDRLLLPIDGSIAGEALEDSAGIAWCWDNPEVAGRGLVDKQYRYVRNRIWNKQKWLVCVRLVHPTDPAEECVVAIDGSHDGDKVAALLEPQLHAIRSQYDEHLQKKRAELSRSMELKLDV